MAECANMRTHTIRKHTQRVRNLTVHKRKHTGQRRPRRCAERKSFPFWSRRRLCRCACQHTCSQSHIYPTDAEQPSAETKEGKAELDCGRALFDACAYAMRSGLVDEKNAYSCSMRWCIVCAVWLLGRYICMSSAPQVQVRVAVQVSVKSVVNEIDFVWHRITQSNPLTSCHFIFECHRKAWFVCVLIILKLTQLKDRRHLINFKLS